MHWLPTHTVHSVIRERVAIIAVAVVGAQSVEAPVDAAMVFASTLICVFTAMGKDEKVVGPIASTGLFQTYSVAKM